MNIKYVIRAKTPDLASFTITEEAYWFQTDSPIYLMWSCFFNFSRPDSSMNFMWLIACFYVYLSGLLHLPLRINDIQPSRITVLHNSLIT